ncbi:MAG: DUF3037 domain-containing protein [Bacteroidota bacterium]|nr:DUF3037 domain-containing protein [Bacteroidota bacterium]
MQEKHLYEYAVIRVLPKVEREEFINAGIILFSKKANYIRIMYKLNIQRLNSFSSELDIDLLEASLNSFEKICQGQDDGGIIAQLDIPERFRWLTAVRSSCIQTSRPHPGFTDNLDQEVEKLFEELVV